MKLEALTPFHLIYVSFCRANRNGIDQFLGYALTKPEVWVVTPRQLIDWMQNPVPLSQMPQFMANYTCTK